MLKNNSFFQQKIIGECSPIRLGAIRVIAVFTALLFVCWENLPSFSVMPRDWYHPLGYMMFMPQSLMYSLLSSFWLLASFKLLLVLFLSLAMVGYQTRFTMPCATFLYLIYISIPRAFSWFFHTGLIPLYLMFFLIFLPSEDGLSFDAKRRIKKGDLSFEHPNAMYAWGVFLLRLVVALCYFQAGYAKLHNSGLSWIEPWNLEHHVVTSTLTLMHFDFRVGLWMMQAFPDWAWSLFAAAAICSELFYPLVLFSWQLRQIYPLVGMALHMSILFIQNIFFPDLIILQLVFYDWDRILNLLSYSSHDRRSSKRGPRPKSVL